MSIINSKYIKYDMTLQEYYINSDCVINYLPYTQDELGNLGLNDKTIKLISHSVYRLIYNYRKGSGKLAHKKYMRLKIYNNSNEEVQVLMMAMLEAVRGAIESGMDLNAYINEPKDVLPHTVIEELKSVELLDRSNKLDQELDITYTSQDETYAT